jgi:ATP-dependent exoDNAse (exonuclease V) beta subunit
VATPVPDTGVTVEGFVDLLYERDRDVVIVDYKTDSVRSDADVDATLGRYRLQGATYALAIEETVGRPVAACVFVFVSGGTPRERSLDGAELEAAKDDVRRLLTAG